MTVVNEKELNSPDVEAYLAMKLLQEGDGQSAIQKCIEAIERFGDNRNCYLVKARAHIESEEYGFAEDALQNVLRLDPEHPAAWAMMGEVYYRLGKETKVDYCRSRLESIFPALAETFLVESDDEEAGEEQPGGDGFEGDSDIEPEAMVKTETKPASGSESIVPLENVEEDLSKHIIDDNGLNEATREDSEYSDDTPADQLEKLSGLKSEMFETATFADICINQGKYEKALKIYEGLLLNDPENRTYKDKVNLIKQKWEDNDSK